MQPTNRPRTEFPFKPQRSGGNSIVKYVVMGVVGLIFLLILTQTTFLTIDPGEKGVIFKPFGEGIVKDYTYNQGFHVIMPWNTMYIYDVRLHEGFETMKVLSKNGLGINIDLTYRYKPIADKIALLHDEIGKDYKEKIIIPEIRSATREVIGKYLPEELYSSKRESIQDEIYERTKKAISDKYVDLDAVLIRNVVLPKTLQAAIERKLKEEQSSLEYEYRLEKERKEAQRRIIEAQAKADANKILNASLTDKILKDKGIEATTDLAKSANTKVVIIGGKDGLPLILGNQ